MAVALTVSLVCSVLVSATAVSLHERQEENRAGSTIRTILTDLDLIREGEMIARARERAEPMIVELATGEILPPGEYDETLNLQDFDIRTLAAHPEYGREIPQERDFARLNRIPKYMKVYTVWEREGESVEKYAFQIYGRGLYSTLYGVIALGPDLKTIEGISFYDHAETPGLGGEIDNPRWKRSWMGKTALGEGGDVLIEVLTGPVDPSRPGAKHQIDGLSGATYTTRGVDNLVKFWLGEDGYGPYLRKLKGS
jgi:Na+-transporting NADH:ubiquinone oxidoreductase subunit C